MIAVAEPKHLVHSPYHPWPKQQIAHSSPADQTLYGGAVGGGKSDFLVAEGHDTLMKIEAQGYFDRVLTLRRTFNELQENIDRALELIGDLAEWKEAKKRFIYPNGSIYQFGHVQHEQDAHKYKSNQYCLIQIDELTSFTEYIWNFLRTRNRTSTPGVKARMRAATNPGDVGHAWVRDYFRIPMPNDDGDGWRDTDWSEVDSILYTYTWELADQCWSEALSQYPLLSIEHAGETLALFNELADSANVGWVQHPDGYRRQPSAYDVWRPKASPEMEKQNEIRALRSLPLLVPPTRCFIPSFLEDNPHLSIDGAYESELYTQDARTIQTLVLGDWSVFEGQFFTEFEETKIIEEIDEETGIVERKRIPWHVIDPVLPTSKGEEVWRAIDYGFTEPTCVFWCWNDKDNDRWVIYKELYKAEMTNQEVCDTILSMTSWTERVDVTYADPISFWQSRSEDSRELQEVYKELGVPLTRANNSRIQGASRIHDLLAMNNRTLRPNLVITKNCVNLIRTLPALVHDKNRQEDIDQSAEDHAYDTLRYLSLSKGESFMKRHSLKIRNNRLSYKGVFPKTRGHSFPLPGRRN